MCLYKKFIILLFKSPNNFSSIVLQVLFSHNTCSNSFIQILCIFDDVVNYSDKEQGIIKEYYIRGRKFGRGISMCYLSQSFFRIPKIIRLQCNYLILLKLGSKKDLALILADYGLGVDKNELMTIYKDATKIPFDFLKISTDERQDSKRFSHNWTAYYDIGSDSDSDI